VGKFRGTTELPDVQIIHEFPDALNVAFAYHLPRDGWSYRANRKVVTD
jgi:hypothetical protein